MEEKNISTLFEEMKSDVSNYINNRIKLAKLEAFEKGSKAGANAGYGLILAVCIFWGLFFALITLALYLSGILGSYTVGFGITAGGILFIVLILLLAGKAIKGSITNKIISQLNKEPHKKK